MTGKKTELDNKIGGLILMIVFTVCWTILSEYFFDNSDFRVAGIIFGIVILYLIISCLKFVRKNKDLVKIAVENDPKKDKWFYIIFALEGIAIFIAKNILVNIDKDNLFVCAIALIVGLHFIPLAKVFNRKFDYYIGVWTTLIAIVGLILILTNRLDFKIVNAFVCAGCALSTAMYGLKKVKDGNNFLETQKH